MEQREKLLPLVNTFSTAYRLSPKLLDAIIQVESSYDPYVYRYEPNFKYVYKVKEFAKKLGITEKSEQLFQQCSFGLAQIMGGTARSMQFKGQLTSLCDPEINLKYVCEYLSKLRLISGNIDDLIASYNAGSVRKTADGIYVNQAYVDKVKSLYLKE